jgi:hypothetical protein
MNREYEDSSLLDDNILTFTIQLSLSYSRVGGFNEKIPICNYQNREI